MLSLFLISSSFFLQLAGFAFIVLHGALHLLLLFLKAFALLEVAFATFLAAAVALSRMGRLTAKPRRSGLQVKSPAL